MDSRGADIGGVTKVGTVRTRLRADDGTTLMELVVGMAIMTIFMGMFTGAVVMMNSAVNKAQAVNSSSSQLNNAFLTLDRTVRYAAAISTPGVGPSGDSYVEFRTLASGSEECTQLQADVATKQLRRRTWKVPLVGGTPAWVSLASEITNGAVTTGADKPFQLKTAGRNVTLQQLAVNLVSPSGAGKAQTTSRSSFSFTALNSTIPVPKAPICQQQGRQ